MNQNHTLKRRKMPRRKKVAVLPTKFHREYEMILDGFEIPRGEIIKVKDEWGMRFKFDAVVTNLETGAQWIDCFEVHKKRTGSLRAFKQERIKRIPKRRGKRRAKRGTADSAAS